MHAAKVMQLRLQAGGYLMLAALNARTCDEQLRDLWTVRHLYVTLIPCHSIVREPSASSDQTNKMNSRQEELRHLSEQVQQAVHRHSISDDPAAYDDALGAIQRLQLAVEKPGDYIARLRFHVNLGTLPADSC